MPLRRFAAVALVLAAAAASACTAPRVGVVESRRVLRESVLALTYQRQLDDREKAMAADLRLLSGQLSAEDLEARRQSYLKDLTEMKQSLETTLNDRIREAVQQVAKRRRLRIVLVKESVNLGGIDVTDDVIAQLK
ncbi:MAG TPA: OmpH family outer membrane protein [bacterium]|nr:OmpH family outer membrane protein [bacterium]